jgi:hypothetical protein
MSTPVRTFSACAHLLGGSTADSLTVRDGLDNSDKRITRVAPPTAPTDAATRLYVDAAVSSATSASPFYKAAARVATVSALNANVAGSTKLTSTAFEVLIVDGVNPTTGDRILVKNEADAVHNGIYQVTQPGIIAGMSWILTRVSDYSVAGDVAKGATIAVMEGSVNARTQWIGTAATGSTPGISELSWAQLSTAAAPTGPPQLTAFVTTSTVVNESYHGKILSLVAPAIKFIGTSSWTVYLSSGVNDQIIMLRNISSLATTAVTIRPDAGVRLLSGEGLAVSLVLVPGQSLTLAFDSSTVTWVGTANGCTVGPP